MKFLVVGGGGREAAITSKLAEDSVVCSFMGHENPLIIQLAEQTGGGWMVGDATNPTEVARFAASQDVDYAFVSSDEPLAAGVVDGLLSSGIKAVGATRAAARIEWDKIWAAGLVDRVCPGLMPAYRIVRNADELNGALSWFVAADLQVVVKPEGLTGGKGVKVMGVHLDTYADCQRYAAELLATRPGEGVLLVERLEGIEFTIQGLTDGTRLVMAPASYDYPYRFVGDVGPGTGGMGCFAGLSFLVRDDLDKCESAMNSVLGEMRRLGLRFTGILYGGFFLTKNGVRLVEFNARFGDPEGLCVLQLLETPLSEAVRRMYHGVLTADAVRFARRASVIKYLVGPEYPDAGKRIAFSINDELATTLGVNVWPAACIKDGGSMVSLGRSRAAAVGMLAGTIPEASGLIEEVIAASDVGGLECRHDIGSEDELRRLTNKAEKTRKR